MLPLHHGPMLINTLIKYDLGQCWRSQGDCLLPPYLLERYVLIETTGALVSRVGFEPTTYGLKVRYSVH